MLANLFVAFLMLVFIAVCGAVFFGDDLGPMIGFENGLHADLLGIPKPMKPVQARLKSKVDPNPNKDGEKDTVKDGIKDKGKGDKDKSQDGHKDKGKDGDKDKGKEKPKEKNKPTPSPLEGGWIVESSIDNGKADDTRNGEPILFADGKVNGIDPGAPMGYTVNETSDPKSFDLIVNEKRTIPGIDLTFNEKRSIPGIYKIEDDKLYVAFPTRKSKSKDRPTTFEGKDAMLVVLRRATKEDSLYFRAECCPFETDRLCPSQVSRQE